MTKRIVLLQALASTPIDIARLLRPVDNEAFRWQPAPEEWSAAAVLTHLGQVEKAYRHRLQRIAHEDEPWVPYIHPEVGDSAANARAADLLNAFETERAQTMAFLQELSPGGWQRPAIHETKGRTTMRYLVQDLVDHDIDHTNQLVTILQKKKRLEIERLRD
jgi:uncharacterized damage-inducible protein DinB